MPLVENHPAACMQSDCTGGEPWNTAMSSRLGPPNMWGRCGSHGTVRKLRGSRQPEDHRGKCKGSKPGAGPGAPSISARLAVRVVKESDGVRGCKPRASRSQTSKPS